MSPWMSAWRTPTAAAALLLLVGASGCSRQLTQDDCARFRDRLRAWAEQKGKGPSDPKAAEAFMQRCVGSTVSRRTARCMELAADEASFFRCLD